MGGWYGGIKGIQALYLRPLACTRVTPWMLHFEHLSTAKCSFGDPTTSLKEEYGIGEKPFASATRFVAINGEPALPFASEVCPTDAERP